MELYSDVIYIQATVDDQITDYYFFDYTAENSYGAAIRSQIVYINGEKYNLEIGYGERPHLIDYMDSNGVVDETSYQNDLELYEKVFSARGALVLFNAGFTSHNNLNLKKSEVYPAQKIMAKI